jgi:SecD/SecF fusion protein
MQKQMPSGQALLMCLTLTCCSTLAACKEPVGAVLNYEIDRDALGSSEQVDMQALIDGINARLRGVGKVVEVNGERFTIEVYGKVDKQRLAALRLRIGAPGALQFRIMASPDVPEHKSIIELAESMTDASTLKIDGKDVAFWSACNSKEFQDENQRGLWEMVFRKKDGSLEALALLEDGQDVTGTDLVSASAESDQGGHPQIDFALSPEGAARFGKLTGDHVPTPDGSHYRMGILLDNKILSAPTINSKITSRGSISGSLSKEETEAIVAIFQQGYLPYRVREVDAKLTP